MAAGSTTVRSQLSSLAQSLRWVDLPLDKPVSPTLSSAEILASTQLKMPSGNSLAKLAKLKAFVSQLTLRMEDQEDSVTLNSQAQMVHQRPWSIRDPTWMDVQSDLISLRTTDVVVVIAAVVVAAVVVASAVAVGVVSAVAVVVDLVGAVVVDLVEAVVVASAVAAGVVSAVVVAEVDLHLASCKPIKEPLEITRAPRLPSEVIVTLYLWLNILVSEARMGVA